MLGKVKKFEDLAVNWGVFPPPHWLLGFTVNNLDYSPNLLNDKGSQHQVAKLKE